ncbi:hypothetical protein NC653_023377 [Populus alba x Populus x berolinensis]|uniref:PPIase cyclophilin-type domain-containing protein n=1 Tax=Populus alba x Populus x berolinensis TaxID=444605 RepID=A0AAD6MH50_9ROSI|nr:hypothetical protein NC653_023377 [Populus alba x Populus x berolinensis]
MKGRGCYPWPIWPKHKWFTVLLSRQLALLIWMENMLYFGKVVKGMGIVRSMEHVTTGDADCPASDVIIVDCGEIPEVQMMGYVISSRMVMLIRLASWTLTRFLKNCHGG